MDFDEIFTEFHTVPHFVFKQIAYVNSIVQNALCLNSMCILIHTFIRTVYQTVEYRYKFTDLENGIYFQINTESLKIKNK